MKTDCKYFKNCGNAENCEGCKGYEKTEVKKMKSVKEIKAVISKLSIQAEKLEREGSSLLDEAKAISNNWNGSRFSDVKSYPDYEKWQELHVAADNAYVKAGEVKRVITVWKFNLLHAKKAELLPIWAEVMKDYEGKAIGPARDKEIHEKLKKLGITGYFSKSEYSSPKINLSFLDNRECCTYTDYIELTGNYEVKFFDDNGKFTMPDLSTFKFYGESTPYIDNPKAYIKSLLKLADKAKKAAAAYNAAHHEYNKAAIPGFNTIDEYKNGAGSIAEYFRIDK